MTVQRPLDTLVEFADNPDPRAPCVLLLDTSGSMLGAKLSELNAGLASFRDATIGDVLARRRVEPAIISFDDEARLVAPFVTADEFQAPTLEARGSTSMGAGIELALRTIEERKQSYKAGGVAYYRPWLVLITDGEPTDGETTERARKALRQAEEERRVKPWIIGVDGANMNFLKTLSTQAPVRMKGIAFKEFFRWLSTSMQRVSGSRPGDKLQVDPPTTWGVIEP